MQYFLDHLASILVVSVVLLIMVLVQIRGTQSAAESTINGIIFTDVVDMTEILKRDLENMLTDPQATAAQTDSSYLGGGVTLCIGNDTTTSGIHAAQHTAFFSFPTRKPPEDVTNSEIIEVRYNLVSTGETITLPTRDSTQTIPLFRINRLVNGLFAGGSGDNVTSFRIETLNRFDDFDAFNIIDGSCSANLRKVRFEFKMAQNGVDFASGDGQTSTSQTNISRFGTTIHLTNWE